MKILEGLIRSVGKGAMAGAVGGSATAVVLIALDTIRPF
jgi:hypothetical protein